ncbi:FtsJ domain-containing protein [Rhizoctonia solani AG-1 IA]|uniref:FtsJ domain-containing protein n=1 Tax=Thanatephorus cucumeris (strain AG1-IA) TaxID=983506 RepID=L8X5N4_THACA|nr:FtsJ domain-containing protein [Rhizoctonia solani AG-1 IA]
MLAYQRSGPNMPRSPSSAFYPNSRGASSPLCLSPALSPPVQCQHHAVPNPRCLGCRMAMGGQADSYMASEDFSVQQCYYSDKPPVDVPAVEEFAPLSPTSESSDFTSPIPGESDEESYLLRMRFAMQELDNQVEFVVGNRFLDLGCCPGGFSTYVLSKLPSIVGDGVSLPVELGGHSLAVPQALRSRFTVHWGDITRFNHASGHAGSGQFNRLATFPIPPNTYDLVIADGHRPPIILKQVGHEQRYARDLLLVSQLLAAIKAVKVGGSILVKLSLSLANQTLDGFMHRVVVALGELSSRVPLVALKPKSIYATAGSFYVLVRGVEAVPRRGLELKLEALWINLLGGGAINTKAINKLVSAKETRNKKEWLAALLEPVQDIRRGAKEARGQ